MPRRNSTTIEEPSRDRQDREIRKDREERQEEQLRQEEQSLGEQLQAYTVAVPSADQTAALAAALAKRWVQGEQGLPSEAGSDMAASKLWLVLRMVQSHMHLFRGPAIAAGGAVLLLGLLFEGMVSAQLAVRPYIFAVPLLAALSVCYAFRSYGTPMFRLEMSMPITPMQLIFGRLALILAYYSGLAAVISCLWPGAQQDLLAFTLSWLVPLAISCLAALVLMLAFGQLAGVFGSIAIWSIQLVINKHLGIFYWFSAAGHEDWLASKLAGLAVIALLLGAAIITSLRISRDQV